MSLVGQASSLSGRSSNVACKSSETVDVDSYNDQHSEQEMIQLVLDFTYDVVEDELGGDFRPHRPR